MLRPSTTSTSRAQAEGQSCGQVEWRISILACWFMAKFVTPKYRPAERIYPATPMRFAQPARRRFRPRPRNAAQSHRKQPEYSLPDRPCQASTVRALPLQCRSRRHQREVGMTARRFALVLAAGLLGIFAAAPSFAQDYPARAVRIIVPFGAGGPADLAARLIGNVLQES